MRKQNLCIFIFQKLFIIAVTDNTTDCFVKGCLMLRLSKTVKKDKISIYLNNAPKVLSQCVGSAFCEVGAVIYDVQ